MTEKERRNSYTFHLQWGIDEDYATINGLYVYNHSERNMQQVMPYWSPYIRRNQQDNNHIQIETKFEVKHQTMLSIKHPAHNCQTTLMHQAPAIIIAIVNNIGK